MKNREAILAVSLMALLSGCGSFAGGMDGRLVTGKCLLGGDITSNKKGADVKLDGKSFHVTKGEITWDQHRSLQLPANWSRLELSESFDSVAINVDGSNFARIAN
jgi:hypothetical protein